MRKILLDTSFAISLATDQGIMNIGLADFELLVPSPVLEELRKMSGEKSARRKRMAEATLDFLSKLKIIEIKTGVRGVDETIADYAREHGLAVATNDVALRSILRKMGVPVMGYRGRRKRIMLSGAFPC